MGRELVDGEELVDVDRWGKVARQRVEVDRELVKGTCFKLLCIKIQKTDKVIKILKKILGVLTTKFKPWNI